MDSGYYTTRISAEEQAAKKILTQENWPLQYNRKFLDYALYVGLHSHASVKKIPFNNTTVVAIALDQN